MPAEPKPGGGRLQERRLSFVEFMQNELSERPEVFESPPPPRKDTLKTALWTRIAHECCVLGYSVHLCTAVLFYILWVSLIKWTARNDEGVFVLDPWATLRGVHIPLFVALSVASWANIAQYTTTARNGPTKARVTLLAYVLTSALVLVTLAALIRGGSVDGKFSGVDLLVIFSFLAVGIYCEGTVRARWAKTSAVGDQPEAAVEEQLVAASALTADGAQAPPQPQPPHSEPQEEEEDGGNIGMLHFIINLVPIIGTAIILFLYPLLIVPTFFSGETPTRLLLCLVLHPLVLEAVDAIGRSTKSSAASDLVRRGELTKSKAEIRVVEDMLTPYATKQLMAFFRRVMLLNMGSASANFTAVVLASLEQAVFRGFVVEIDTALRRFRGRPPLDSGDMVLQRLVWMCDCNQSAIAELNAILLSAFVQVALEGSALMFALGYSPDAPLKPPAVFAQLILELTLELAVANVCFWAEAERGIPVLDYFKRVRSIKVMCFHLCISIFSLALVLYAFMRHPTVLTCSSSYVCGCTEQPVFGDWHAEACEGNPNETVGASAATASAADGDGDALLDDLPLIEVTVAVVAGLATLALVALSVLFARYQIKSKTLLLIHGTLVEKSTALGLQRAKIEAMSTENMRLKASLHQAQTIVEQFESDKGLEYLRLDFNELTLQHSIGEGSFGTVFLGDYRGENVAVKMVRSTRLDLKCLELFTEEIRIMAAVRSHANICTIIGGCWQKADEICIVLEYCRLGSFSNLLSKVDELGYGWSDPFQDIVRGVADGLSYLHHGLVGRALIHRDLKPANVLVAADLSARVCDFGESRWFDAKDAKSFDGKSSMDDVMFGVMTMSVVGTPMYTAPEVLVSAQYNAKCDVYSFGVLLFEVAAAALGEKAHRGIRTQFACAGLGKISQGWRPTLPQLSEESSGYKLVVDTWSQDANLRPSFIAISERLQDGVDFTFIPSPRDAPSSE